MNLNRVEFLVCITVSSIKHKFVKIGGFKDSDQKLEVLILAFYLTNY